MDILTGSPASRTSSYQRTSMERSTFGQTLTRQLSPVVMVLCTPEAERICQKNGLSFKDMLNAHAEFRNLNIPVRTAGDHSYRLHEFRVRVFNAKEIIQTSPEAADQYLSSLLTSSADAADAELAGIDPADVPSIVEAVSGPSSWSNGFLSEYTRSLSFSDHETFDHPVACILVVHSHDPHPLSAFQSLLHADALPPLYTQQLMDPQMHRHFVLLHDMGGGEEGVLERVDSVLSSMRGTFGSNVCRLLPLNSVSSPRTAPNDIWSKHMQPTMSSSGQSRSAAPAAAGSPGESVGRFLSDPDIQEIADFMRDLVSKHIVPHMEHKIREHNAQVSANRRGLRNQIKSLWGFGKGREEEGESVPGVYTYKSTESQIRVLADFAFMLQDFVLANESYRLLASDYKRDKAWRHYAGAQEMLGLTTFLVDGSRREAEQCLESAWATYLRCASPQSRYALRVCIWLSGALKSRGQWREAALTLLRGAMEDSGPRAPILLENASFSFLSSSPPMLRKYGFHLVLAGNRYNLGGQRRHALRVYRLALLGVYQPLGWKFITDHCQFTLGRLSAFLGSYDTAIPHFSSLLASSHQSPTMQTTFLREFLYVVQQQQKLQQQQHSSALDSVLLALPLPELQDKSVRVSFQDHRTFATPAAARVPEQIWAALETGIVPAVTLPLVPTWLDAALHRAAGGGGAAAALPLATNTSVKGEDIVVEIELLNPLHVPIEVANALLLCEFSSPKQQEEQQQGTGAEAKATSDALHRIASSPTFRNPPSVPPSTNEGEEMASIDLSSRAEVEESLEDEGGDARSTPGARSHSQPNLSSLSEETAAEEQQQAQREGREVEGNAQAEGVPAGGGGGGEEAAAAIGDGDEDIQPPPFMALPLSFRLQPSEKATVRLSVRPLSVGLLRVTGMQWTVVSEGRQATGRRKFSVALPKPRKKGGGPGRQVPPHQRLSFHIVQEMPRLEVHLHGLPSSVQEGEMRRVVLELVNASSVPLGHLRLKTNHPEIFFVGQPEELDAELPGSLEKKHTDPGNSCPSDPHSGKVEREGGGAGTYIQPTWPAAGEGKSPRVQFSAKSDGNGGSDSGKKRTKDGSIFRFPTTLVLDAGSTLLWPMWLHTRAPGPLTLNTIVYYEAASTQEYRADSENSGPKAAVSASDKGEGRASGSTSSHEQPALKYRTLRITHALQVLPSLHLSLRLFPSPSSLSHFLLRLDVENRQSQGALWLRQVSCLSPSSSSSGSGRWSISPLPALSPSPPPPSPPNSMDLKIASEGDGCTEGGLLVEKGTSSLPVVEDPEQEESSFLAASLAPPQLLPSGQGTSLFFQLRLQQQEGEARGEEQQHAGEKAERTRVEEDEVASQGGQDVSLGGQEQPLVEVGGGPIGRFHSLERALQAEAKGAAFESGCPLDIVLVWEKQQPQRAQLAVDGLPVLAPDEGAAMGMTHKGDLSSFSPVIGSHHICGCQVSALEQQKVHPPLHWTVHGPPFLQHDFASHPTCTVRLTLRVRNFSVGSPVSLLLRASDPMQQDRSNKQPPTPSHTEGNKPGGWFIPATSIGVADALDQAASLTVPSSPTPPPASPGILLSNQPCSLSSSGPYAWTGMTAVCVNRLDPGAETDISMAAVVFGPGVYNLSDYQLSWKWIGGGRNEVESSSEWSTGQGSPFLVVVLAA